VELLDFTATYNEPANQIDVRWKTVSEKNNAGFIVMKSEDPAFGFSELDSYLQNPSLIGQGTTSQTHFYGIPDKSPIVPGKTYYYQLYQVDFDGKINRSPIVNVTIPLVGADLLTVFPNPTSDIAHFQIQLFQQGEVELEVFDLRGNKISSIVNQELESGTHTFNWNTEEIASGMYIYRLKTPTSVLTGKIQVN
ncbi:MAG: T9SS type A sorting domain-containing protein, partial [Bacteroidia bacterium]|nr:T9SS type A sorting domain-containing protein [Bacteroidia bacterium]